MKEKTMGKIVVTGVENSERNNKIGVLAEIFQMIVQDEVSEE